jgi:hypothetical protein
MAQSPVLRAVDEIIADPDPFDGAAANRQWPVADLQRRASDSSQALVISSRQYKVAFLSRRAADVTD